MSSVEQAREAVAAARSSSADAMAAADDARSAASGLCEWAGAMGLDAMVAVLEQAVDALAEATTGWSGTEAACHRAATGITTVADAPGRSDVTALLAAVAEHLTAASTAAAGARMHTSDATSHTAQTQLDDLVETITVAAAAGDAVDVAIRAAIGAVEALRQGAASSTGAGSPGAGAGSPRAGPGGERRVVVPPYRSERHKADEIAPYVDHRTHNGTPVAFGRLYSQDGTPLTPVHIAADQGPARDRASDLTEPLRSSPKLLRHIEGHAAARMRADKRRVAVLYINREPCDYPVGCDRNLRAILPEGYTLYVHQVFRNGGTKIWPYEGTGEALANREEFR